jgi:hypothetical protein
MKKTQLVKIIQDAVRDELKRTLPSILDEVLSINKKTSEKKPKNDILEQTKLELAKNRKKSDLKKYSKNPAINKILNETVGGIPQEGTRVMNESETKTTDFNGAEVNLDNLPDHVSTALTRNYSDVLSAINKKKGIN